MSGDNPVCTSKVCLGRVLAQPAVLKSSMSTPTAAIGSQTITSSSVTPPAPMATTPTREESGQRGANYFFGFVFMFTVILLVIVGCGIGSRRRYFSGRRAADQSTLDPWSSGSKGDIEPPMLYDMEAKSNFVDPWTDILPLSATYLGKEHDELNEKSEKDDRSSTRTTSRTPHNLITPSRLLFPTWRARSSRGATTSLPERPEAVRMAVLIVMPVPHDHSADDAHHDINGGSDGSNISTTRKDLPEVQIGVETLSLRKS